MAVQDETRARATAAYVSYRTFRNFFERMDVVPSRIDRPLLSYTAGATQTQLMHAFRALGLTMANNDTTAEMERLHEAFRTGDKSVLKALLERSYPAMFEPNFNLARASHSQVRERFEAMGISGETVRKAIAFFIAAARDAEIVVSEHVRVMGGSQPARRPPSNGGGAAIAERQVTRVRRRRPASTGGADRSGTVSGNLPAPIASVLGKLKADGTPWSAEDKKRFLNALEVMLDYCYPLESEK